jgi:MFS transporter, DHA2 family, multidrug resistance protein
MTTTAAEVNPHRWYIIAAVMLSTVMEILDTTIVNVSLPHMMGSLNADRDQISWILTSYIVAAGVLMPLTGFMVARLGSKRLLLINIAGFMLASMLCGLATNLGEMVFFRLLQGLFGASLMPLSQFILRETFLPAEQPKVMAIWGIGVMSAPVMGPTLGGFITDTLNWRWIFFLNIPVCIIDFMLVIMFIKSSPIKRGVIDWLGMILMFISIGALQLFLDRGQVDDWFASDTICCLFMVFLVSFTYFLIHCWRSPNPIINLRLFADRNFAFGTLIMAFFSASILGCITLLPQMLETLFGYTSELSGLIMAPRGITSAMTMGFVARMMMKGVDPRYIIATGLAIGATTLWQMGDMSLDTNMGFLILNGAIQGIGIGCFFMPLTAMVYSTLPHTAIAEASGLFNFGRNLGNALGISILVAYLDRDSQANWNVLASHVKNTNPNFIHWLKTNGYSLADPHTLAKLSNTIMSQANFVAYLHTFQVGAFIIFAACLMTRLMKRPPKRQTLAVDAH